MEAVPAKTIQDEVFDFLITSPTLQEIIDFHASEEAQARLRYLLEANRNGILKASERIELEETSQINHFFILLKARTQKALKEQNKTPSAPSPYSTLL